MSNIDFSQCSARSVRHDETIYEEGIPRGRSFYSRPKSIYFSDPNGHQLEVYCDDPPEYLEQAKGNKYTGIEKLDFAPDEPGIAQAFGGTMALQ